MASCCCRSFLGCLVPAVRGILLCSYNMGECDWLAAPFLAASTPFALAGRCSSCPVCVPFYFPSLWRSTQGGNVDIATYSCLPCAVHVSLTNALHYSFPFTMQRRPLFSPPFPLPPRTSPCAARFFPRAPRRPLPPWPLLDPRPSSPPPLPPCCCTRRRRGACPPSRTCPTTCSCTPLASSRCLPSLLSSPRTVIGETWLHAARCGSPRAKQSGLA